MTVSNNPDGISANKEAENPVGECNLDHIPLFPVRYALTGDTVEKAKDGKACGKPPSSLAAVDNVTFELARVRCGYVNIFVESGLGTGSDSENMWHVFYHYTSAGDDNSSLPRIDTEKMRSGIPRYFYKYKWDNGSPDGSWSKYLKDGDGAQIKTYPYPFVALGSSKVWVAYSEERWPAHFFKRAQADASFRQKIMTMVQITGKPGQSEKYAPLTDLPNLARSFNPETSSDVYSFSNTIRHTPIEQEKWQYVANSLCARERGYVVLVNDPVAMALDLGAILILNQRAKEILSQENNYALVTGEIVEGLEKAGAIRTKTWSILPRGEDRPHIDDFTLQFENVKRNYINALGYLNEIDRGVFSVWTGLIDQTGDGSIHDNMMLYKQEFDAAAAEDKAEIAGTALFEIGRAAQAFALCSNAPIEAYFDGILAGVSKGPGGAAMAELIGKFGAALSTTLTVLSEKDFFYVLGYDAAIQTFSARLNKRGGDFYFTGQKLVNTIETRVVTFSTEAEARQAVQTLYAEGRYGAALSGQLPRGMSGNVVLDRQPGPYPGASPRASYSIQAVQVSIRQAPPPEWIQRADRLAEQYGSGTTLSGLAMVAAGFALQSAIGKWSQAKEYSQVRDWLFDPAIVTIAAFLNLVREIIKVEEVVQSMGPSSAAFYRIYARFPGLKGVTVAQVSQHGNAGRAMKALTGKAAGVITGVYLAASDLNDGWDRHDSNLITSGLLGGGSVIFFLAAGATTGPAGWFLLALAALAAVGSAVYGYFKLNNYELWVREGIWGGDERNSWWGRDRLLIENRLITAQAFAHKNMPDHKFASDSFVKELERFFDMTASLNIVNKSEGDGKIDILCAELKNPVNLNQLSLNVRLMAQWEVNGAPMARGLTYLDDYTIHFEEPGRASIKIEDAVFSNNQPRDILRPEIYVSAEFVRPNGKKLDGKGRFDYDIDKI